MLMQRPRPETGQATFLYFLVISWTIYISFEHGTEQNFDICMKFLGCHRRI